jgi:hypothetical protein
LGACPGVSMPYFMSIPFVDYVHVSMSFQTWTTSRKIHMTRTSRVSSHGTWTASEFLHDNTLRMMLSLPEFCLPSTVHLLVTVRDARIQSAV